MDGPWFVGDQCLHVQAWEADFHPHVAKIFTMVVWIRLEHLPIEYYHPEFLHHVGNKLGKLLKIDAVTSAAIRGRLLDCVSKLISPTHCQNVSKSAHFGKTSSMKICPYSVTNVDDLDIGKAIALNQIWN